MKIQLLLKILKVSSLQIDTARIRIRFAKNVELYSAEQRVNGNCFVFMEKNIIQLGDNSFNYISFDLISDRKVIANKTLFLTEAKLQKNVLLKGSDEGDKFDLSFDMVITETEKKQDPSRLNEVPKPKEKESPILSSENNLKIFKLGLIMYNFSKRIDPLIILHDKILSILQWDQPQLTVTIGVIATFAVIFPKVTALLLALLIVFGKQEIYAKLQSYQKNKNLSERIILPEANLVFLQNSMQNYCDIFQKVNSFIRCDNRTQIVTIVETASKFGVLLMCCFFFLEIQTICIIGIWSLLIVMSPLRMRLFKFFTPKLLNANKYVDKMIKKVEKSQIGELLKFKKGSEITKELYAYEYQRWWVGTEWAPAYWSDENRETTINPLQVAPQGWSWLEDWTICKSQNTDENGFEYSNDFIKEYTSNTLLKTIRRRKWRRVCILNTKGQSYPELRKITSTPSKRTNYT